MRLSTAQRKGDFGPPFYKGNIMTVTIEVLKQLTYALEWAMPYAEKEHERQYPGETYESDNYVALSVYKARGALTLGREYIDWLKSQ